MLSDPTNLRNGSDNIRRDGYDIKHQCHLIRENDNLRISLDNPYGFLNILNVHEFSKFTPLSLDTPETLLVSNFASYLLLRCTNSMPPWMGHQIALLCPPSIQLEYLSQIFAADMARQIKHLHRFFCSTGLPDFFVVQHLLVCLSVAGY